MNRQEAAKAVALLATAYPLAAFPEESAAAYEGFLADLDYPRVAVAINSLVKSSTFLPSVAEIRNEVARSREVARRLEAAKPLLPPASSGPAPEVWGRKLSEMLEASDRYKRMAEKWFASKGRAYPGDPAKPLIDVCTAGARGDDVRGSFKRTVLNEQDETERRYP